MTMFSAGTLAPAIGAAIGGAMGSLGLPRPAPALPSSGGGSLARGGFGMAGGVLLLQGAAGAGYKGSRYLATSLASEWRAAFNYELATLHVAYRLSESDEAVASSIFDALCAIAVGAGPSHLRVEPPRRGPDLS